MSSGGTSTMREMESEGQSERLQEKRNTCAAWDTMLDQYRKGRVHRIWNRVEREEKVLKSLTNTASPL